MERPIWIGLSKVDQVDEDTLDNMLEEMAETFPNIHLRAVGLGDTGLTALTRILCSF